jgi:hypothetical protein
MNPNSDEERQRVQKQFSPAEWARLMASPDFKEAWKAGQLIQCGEIADRTLEGECKSRAQLKKRLPYRTLIKNLLSEPDTTPPNQRQP